MQCPLFPITFYGNTKKNLRNMNEENYMIDRSTILQGWWRGQTLNVLCFYFLTQYFVLNSQLHTLLLTISSIPLWLQIKLCSSLLLTSYNQYYIELFRSNLTPHRIKEWNKYNVVIEVIAWIHRLHKKKLLFEAWLKHPFFINFCQVLIIFVRKSCCQLSPFGIFIVSHQPTDRRINPPPNCFTKVIGYDIKFFHFFSGDENILSPLCKIKFKNILMNYLFSD